MHTIEWANYLAGTTGAARVQLTAAARDRAVSWCARTTGTDTLLEALAILQTAHVTHDLACLARAQGNG